MASHMARPTAQVVIGGTTYPVEPGAVTLDEGWAPYCQGTVVAPFDDPNAIAALDPRTGVRATLQAGAGGALRSFNLGVRSRVIDYESKNARITLASDEALLQDYAPLADDKTPRASESSLRAVCNYVIGKVIPGTTLQSGTANADATAQWSLTNALPNPAHGVDIVGWSPGFNSGSLQRVANSTTPAASGWALRWVASGAGSAISAVPSSNTSSFPVRAGQSYVYTVYAYGSAARTADARIQWWSSDGTVLISESRGSNVVLDATGVWKRLTVIATAPAGATSVAPVLVVQNSVSNDAFLLSSALLYQGDEVVPYFDGAKAADSRYTYAWSGTAHASPSRRTAKVERPPSGLVWSAGVTGWDFLVPLLTAAGLRLFCDELRAWRLVNDTYTIAGVVAMTSDKAVEGTDRISREEPALSADGVVIRYRWDDPELGPQLKVDAAGSPGRVFVEIVDRPYPGPGAAGWMLQSMRARGRVQEVAGFTDYTATPAMQSRLVLPGSPLVVGRVSAVSFDLESGVITLVSKGQMTVPTNSWAEAPPTKAWNQLAAGVTWQNYTTPPA